MSYTVLVYEAEEGGYWAEVAELPGCASQGETLDELEHNILEAIESCLAVYAEDGDLEPPRPVRKWELPYDDFREREAAVRATG